MTTSTPTGNDYRAAAQVKFRGFMKAYTSGVSYWKLGTGFDTIIDYLDVIVSSAASDLAKTVELPRFGGQV
jgi:hypothetical protein